MPGAAFRNSFEYVDEEIADQILAGRDADFLRARLDVERAAELLRALEETDGVWQEPPALLGEHGQPARPAALAVQFDAQALLECQKAVAQSLFRDPEH